jgi:hypothetical protein
VSRDVVASNPYYWRVGSVTPVFFVDYGLPSANGKNSRDYEKWDLKLLSTLAKAADTQNSVVKDGVRAIVKGVEM